jgi:hypothetical protein
MSPVYPFECWEQLTGFNTGFEIRVFLLLDGLPSRVNELHLPKELVLRRQDPAFAPFFVRQNSSTTGRSGVGLWLSETIFYACRKEHLPDSGSLSPVSPLGITILGTTCLHAQCYFIEPVPNISNQVCWCSTKWTSSSPPNATCSHDIDEQLLIGV